jgi:hypothetical protein
MQTLSIKVGISLYKLRSWFRDLGIDNYQQLKVKLSDSEWCDFWKTKLC